jgi:hypothetical protein
MSNGNDRESNVRRAKQLRNFKYRADVANSFFSACLSLACLLFVGITAAKLMGYFGSDTQVGTPNEILEYHKE